MNKIDDLRGVALDLAVARELGFHEVCSFKDMHWNQIIFEGVPLVLDYGSDSYRDFTPHKDLEEAWFLKDSEKWSWNMTEVYLPPTSGVRFIVLRVEDGQSVAMLSTAFVEYASRKPSRWEKEQATATARCIAWLKAKEREEKGKGEKKC